MTRGSKRTVWCRACSSCGDHEGNKQATISTDLCGPRVPQLWTDYLWSGHPGVYSVELRTQPLQAEAAMADSWTFSVIMQAILQILRRPRLGICLE